ncbi:hypothetical protein BGZ73_003796 [Actinomortierella ambigua]|nr:hypothetical protein BGZ73_003796 [Actinomortierella ambigua]
MSNKVVWSDEVPFYVGVAHGRQYVWILAEEDGPLDEADEVEQQLMEASCDRMILSLSAATNAQAVSVTPDMTSTASRTDIESSRKQLQSLQALRKVLIESPSPLQQYSLDDVKNAAYKDHSFADRELEVVRDLASRLSPYFPRRWLTEDGDTHALQLGPQQLFETLCAPTPGHFDIAGANGMLLTGVADVTASKGNKKTVFSSFFDLSKIESLCRDHGLQFRDRIIFIDSDTINIVGRQLTNSDDPRRHPIVNKPRQQVMTNEGRWHRLWRNYEEQGWTEEDVEYRIADAKSRADAVSQQLASSRGRLQQLVAAAKAAVRIFREDKSNRSHFASMKEHQGALLENHDKVVSGKRRVVACWAEDPGVCVMSHNVPRSIEDATMCYKEVDEAPKIMARSYSEIQEARAQAQKLMLPPAIKITAKGLHQTSFTQKYMKERERALKDPKNAAASGALKAVSSKEAALSSATSLKNIDDTVSARRLVKAEIRRFNNTRQLKKLRRTKRDRDRRAVAKAAGRIRDSATDYTLSQTQSESEPPSIDPATGYCSKCDEYEVQRPTADCFKHPKVCVKHKAQVVHLGFVGDAGAGIGPRIGGHLRRGGNRLRAAHRQHSVVAVTNEHLTSRRDGTIATVSVKGSMECLNAECSFTCGYTMKPRDSQGAFNIGTNGYQMLTTGNPLPPFSNEHQIMTTGNLTRVQLPATEAMGTPQWGYT